jgi:hypothetical protein
VKVSQFVLNIERVQHGLHLSLVQYPNDIQGSSMYAAACDVEVAAAVLSFKLLMSATEVQYTQSFTYTHGKEITGFDQVGQDMGPARQSMGLENSDQGMHALQAPVWW